MKGDRPLAFSDIVRVTEFWMNVDRRGDDECWPWTGYINEHGYGEYYFLGRMVGAHELAVTLTTGERRLPGLDTCHSCGNPICCHPAHLRFDTRLSNVADTIAMGRNYTFPRQVDDDTVRLIRLRRQAGASQDDLARQYGISAAYVSQIVNGLARLDAGGPIATERKYFRRKKVDNGG
jgi:DNA-binding XRE family transcriptional regulator